MPPERPDNPSAMGARARLVTRRDSTAGGRAVSRLQVLRSQAPLVLRPTRPRAGQPLTGAGGDAVHVSLASGAAGPLGGDDFRLDIRVGAGSTLVLNEISATLLLPGARGGRSQMRITVQVEAGATFLWWPEPVIAAQGCDHRHDIRVDLAADARFLLRDELILGRHREPPGRLTQNVRIRRAGRALFHQQLQLGAAVRGSTSPAVVGVNKCVGTLLVVDPAWENNPPAARPLARDAALLPLVGPAMMVSALATETLSVRRLLEQGRHWLGEPWAPTDRRHSSPGAAAALPPRMSALSGGSQRTDKIRGTIS